MLHFQFSSRLSPQDLWFLSKTSAENPQESIYRFFDTYSLPSIHDRLWQTLRLTISSDEINEWNEIERANCFHFYELLFGLLKANYILFLKMKGEPSSK